MNTIPFLIGRPEIIREFQSILARLHFEVYLVGGTVRNALYASIFHQRLLQRDFDIACPKEYMQELRLLLLDCGFVPGNIQRDDQYTMKKPAKENPQTLSDFIVFDISECESDSLLALKKVDFTIGGSILPFSKILETDWKQYIF